MKGNITKLTWFPLFNSYLDKNQLVREGSGFKSWAIKTVTWNYIEIKYVISFGQSVSQCQSQSCRHLMFEYLFFTCVWNIFKMYSVTYVFLKHWKNVKIYVHILKKHSKSSSSLEFCTTKICHIVKCNQQIWFSDIFEMCCHFLRMVLEVSLNRFETILLQHFIVIDFQ